MVSGSAVGSHTSKRGIERERERERGGGKEREREEGRVGDHWHNSTAKRELDVDSSALLFQLYKKTPAAIASTDLSSIQAPNIPSLVSSLQDSNGDLPAHSKVGLPCTISDPDPGIML